jgi:outer membrane protein OmpA-like peptidoglycan-associated protein
MRIIVAHQMPILALLMAWSGLTGNAPSETSRPPPRGTLDYQLHRVEFQVGRPRSDESFEESATPLLSDQVKLLAANLAFLQGAPAGLGVQIVGATDTNECYGAECRELSLRRAQCVYRWLVQHGLPPSRLTKPRGDGADYPIDDNESEEGRQSNRRVQFELVPLKFEMNGYDKA